jgi:hypothetical protein
LQILKINKAKNINILIKKSWKGIISNTCFRWCECLIVKTTVDQDTELLIFLRVFFLLWSWLNDVYFKALRANSKTYVLCSVDVAYSRQSVFQWVQTVLLFSSICFFSHIMRQTTRITGASQVKRKSSILSNSKSEKGV